MTFELEKFVAAPTQGELMTLKKDELLLIVKHYKLEGIKRSMRKAAICNSLLRYFVEQGNFDESEVEYLEETEVGNKFGEQLAMRKLEIEERQREKDREIEERQREKDREERQKNKEFELELKKWNWKKGRKTEK